MSVHFEEFVWRGIRPHSREKLSRLAKSSIRSFFRYYPDDVTVSLVCFKACPGGDRNSLIKIVPLTADFGSHPVGVSVSVYLEGTQGLYALFTLEGLSDLRTRRVLSQGPYNKKPAQITETQSAIQDSTPVAAVSDASNGENKPSEEVTYEARDDIDKELLSTGLAQHDLECLRAFYLELRDKFFNGFVEGYVFIPNDQLTPLIEEALGVAPRFGADFGAVYSSRIRPFAENRTQSNVKGWNFKVRKVLTFIDGQLLPRMAHAHPHVMQVPTSSAQAPETFENIHSSEPALPIPLDDANVMLNVLNGDVGLAAKQLLQVYTQHMAAQAQTKKALAEAETRRNSIVEETEALRKQLEDIQSQLKLAESKFADANLEVSKALAAHRKVLELIHIPEEVKKALQVILEIQQK